MCGAHKQYLILLEEALVFDRKKRGKWKDVKLTVFFVWLHKNCLKPHIIAAGCNWDSIHTIGSFLKTKSFVYMCRLQNIRLLLYKKNIFCLFSTPWRSVSILFQLLYPDMSYMHKHIIQFNDRAMLMTILLFNRHLWVMGTKKKLFFRLQLFLSLLPRARYLCEKNRKKCQQWVKLKRRHEWIGKSRNSFSTYAYVYP